jgi:hypothetical protein
MQGNILNQIGHIVVIAIVLVRYFMIAIDVIKNTHPSLYIYISQTQAVRVV